MRTVVADKAAPEKDRRSPRERVFQWTRDRLALAAVVAAFGVSRVAYAIAGVRFSTEPLESTVQLVDLSLLEDDLWRSIWHLHTQPPLYNAFVGVLMQLPLRESISFH